MDAKKYNELRDQLRAHVAAQEAGFAAVREFARAVAARISQQHDKQAVTCRAGIVRGGEFVPKGFDTEGSTAFFAIQVNFDDRKGAPLFQAAVSFNARVAGDMVNIQLDNGADWVNYRVNQLATEDAELNLARIVDLEVEAAVIAATGNAIEVERTGGS